MSVVNEWKQISSALTCRLDLTFGYQHPELTELNQAINRRNRERDAPKDSQHFGHTLRHTASKNRS